MTGLSRRRLIAALARLPVLLAGAWTVIVPRPATAQASLSHDAGNALDKAGADDAAALDPHHIAILERLAWLLFPVPDLAAAPYQRVAAGIAESVRSQPDQLALVRDGTAELDSAAGGRFLDLAEAQQIEEVGRIESGAFFRFLYPAVRSRLWDDREVWALIGYEGSSLERGGYLHRGLNDIDWL